MAKERSGVGPAAASGARSVRGRGVRGARARHGSAGGAREERGGGRGGQRAGMRGCGAARGTCACLSVRALSVGPRLSDRAHPPCDLRRADARLRRLCGGDTTAACSDETRLAATLWAWR